MYGDCENVGQKSQFNLVTPFDPCSALLGSDFTEWTRLSNKAMLVNPEDNITR